MLLGASASALEQDDAARGHLLRAVRLARAGHAAAMAPDGRITDRQALADLLAALAALGEHLLTAATPEPEAAALLGPSWQCWAPMHRPACRRAGRRVR